MDEFQYYPTPRHLAKVVWSGFKTNITAILDPHAGGGDLVTPYLMGFPEDWDPRVAKRRAEYLEKERYYHNTTWHACEINMQMHPSLKEAGAVIVGCDFFGMQSAAIYSHLVLNPPFRNGDKHLMHAWNIFYAGEIGCILNASTIRNPSTAEARKIVELIEKYGSVQYLENQFLGEGVERETAVEVAVIHLHKVPDATLNLESILSNLKPDRYVPHEDEFDALQAVALPMNFIERVMLDYTVAVNAARELAEAAAIFDAAEQRLGLTFTEMQTSGVDANTRPEPINIAVKTRGILSEKLFTLRERAWGQVLRSSDVLNLLTTKGRKAVESQFTVICQMEFNRDNILAFISGLQAAQGELAKDMALEVFDMIIGQDTSNCTFYKSWKSNEKHRRLGMRIRKSRFVLPLAKYSSLTRSFSSDVTMHLRDMDRVFEMLANYAESKGENIARSYFDLNTTANRDFDRLSRGERVKTTWFDLRFFKGAGTFHFYPNSQLMIDKLNMFVGAARQWLPPDMEQANADFKKQYEKAESFTDAYHDQYKKSGTRKSDVDLSYIAREVEKGELERVFFYDAFVDAITAAHDALGIAPNNVLTAERPASKQTLQAPAPKLLAPAAPPAALHESTCITPVDEDAPINVVVDIVCSPVEEGVEVAKATLAVVDDVELKAPVYKPLAQLDALKLKQMDLCI